MSQVTAAERSGDCLLSPYTLFDTAVGADVPGFV
jgi:hypothetical protein